MWQARPFASFGLGRTSRCVVCALLAAVLALAAATASASARGRDCPLAGKADLILHGGKILTVDEKFRTAHAVAVRRGRIIAVSRRAGRLRRCHSGPGTQTIHLEGKTVIPGLIDSHLHQMRAALDIPNVQLLEARSIADVTARIAERVAETPPGEWVIASALWHESLLAEGRMPTRADLDPVSPDNPVFIPRGGHVATVNSAALELAGITAATPDPPGGVIVRDPATGEPTGVLLESAVELVERLLPPPPPPEEQKRLLQQAMRDLNASGITSVTEPGLSDAAIELYTDLWRSGQMTTRTHMLYGVFTGGLEAMQHAVETYSTDFGDDMLRFDGAKVLLDGGVEGARLYEPYQIVPGEQPDPNYRGVLLLPDGGREELVAAYRLAAEHGWQVQTHAVGDETIDIAVAAYAEVDRDVRLAPLRWAIMHIFLPTEHALETMARLGILATVQDHPVLLGFNQIRWWGMDRAAYAIPIRSILDHGIVTGGGTDAPVVPADPFLSMWWMVTRDTLTAGVLGPEQAITRREALELLTIGSARTQFAENRLGSIEVGKLADMVVLSRNPLRGPVDSIRDVQALTTIVAGKIVYQREEGN